MIRLSCVLNAIGKILIIVSVAALLPVFWSLALNDGEFFHLLVSMILYALIGLILVYSTKNKKSVRAKEGFLIVTLSWLFVSVIGAVPYVLSGIFPDYVSAFFETMSGFTTTGGTAISNVETIPGSLLVWRAMTQWLGGLGVVVLFVAILSQMDTGGLTMLRAELSGPFNEKITSKVKDSAMYLWMIYTILTFVLFLLLISGGMNLTDAICHSFSTIATGGFSTKNASISAFGSTYIEYVILVFMFIGGISFPLIFKTFTSRSFKSLITNEEFRVYSLFSLIIASIVFLDLFLHSGQSVSLSIRESLFQTVSQLTTTGFTSCNYNQWPVSSYMIMFCLMLVGASYSSTSGSLKIGTYILVGKSIKSQFLRMLHPRAMTEVKMNGKTISDKTVMKVLQFVILFFVIAFIGAVLLSVTGLSFREALTGAIAAISNNGVAMGALGPSGNYAFVSSSGKLVLSALMLLGRLEIYTVLIIFVPAFWRK